MIRVQITMQRGQNSAQDLNQMSGQNRKWEGGVVRHLGGVIQGHLGGGDLDLPVGDQVQGHLLKDASVQDRPEGRCEIAG